MTAADLRTLVVAWLQGDLGTTPWHCGPPAEETARITAELVALNEAGWMTDESQPAALGPDGLVQRAHVSGYCSSELADRIESAVMATDLVVQVWPADMAEAPYALAVSKSRDVACTWAGGHSPEDLLEGFYSPGPDAVADVLRGSYVDVIDPVWGRSDVLWTVLLAAV